VLCCC
jgi:hypothetical protein